MDQSPDTVAQAVEFEASFADRVAAAVREKLGPFRSYVSEHVFEAAIGKVVEQAAQVLDAPFAELLTGAWERYPEIRELADARRHPSDEETMLELAEHRFAWEYEPKIELVFNETYPVSIPLNVGVGVTVLGGVLVVQGGKFRELRAGRLRVGVQLTVAGQEMEPQSRDIELPRVFRFGEGIAIRETVPVGKIAAPEPEPAPAS
ncbi:MAG TPA: hypothetical protein VF092_30685 [Longimicrobium sp.]